MGSTPLVKAGYSGHILTSDDFQELHSLWHVVRGIFCQFFKGVQPLETHSRVPLLIERIS